jgi:uncharacterized protein YjeT (DUF2065 family)
MLNNIFIAIGLMLILEGILPLLSPTYYKHFISYLLQLDDKIIRILGFVVILIGLIVIFYIAK